ncbi:hypothetical protein [Streptomyces sp. NPDC092370]|uniref:hypothetical protein n=1 Tax=Streptomyces sp. NPDC092370 TaxID=3366016 RepID=UPI00382532F4
MGKSASREDRDKRSSFSVSYEGSGQRDPSTHVKLGRLSYKGPATAVVALALVAAGGVVAYRLLDDQGDAGGTGAGPGTSVTSGAGATSDTNTTAATTGGTTDPTPAASGPAASPPGGATPAADGGAGAAVVREHRKVVLRSGSSVDLDFTKQFSDITFTMPSNGNGWTLGGASGDLATVDGAATAESCAAATRFGFTIDQKNVRRGLTACVLTDENRVAALTVLGWQKNGEGLSSITMDVTTWENSEAG